MFQPPRFACARAPGAGVRGELRPVIPVTWNGFELRRFDFFDRNLALTLLQTP